MSWDHFCNNLCCAGPVTVDLADMAAREPDGQQIRKALAAMAELERGAIANPDEKRRVGHFWLRAPELAPTAELAGQISDVVTHIKGFAARVRAGSITTPRGERFRDLLLVGIGGSALGPMLLAEALGDRTLHVLDNTDPDGIVRTLARLKLATTLVMVISKSGTTVETRNATLAAQAAFERAGLDFGGHAVAVTCAGSELDCSAEGWLARYPLWDWVGGRFSLTSAAGLLPAALMGVDIDRLLAGAAAMDRATRSGAGNPALRLALAWQAVAPRAMVVIPYCDRLSLLGRYLQQLVMESLGKARDLDGNLVMQGLTVYGNKGSTDQHAYVQQLRDGRDDFFVTFVEVLAGGTDFPIVDDTTCGDYLSGFLHGTRTALTTAGRRSLTITLERLAAGELGALIALFERAVGYYASLIGVNAYHQPGVEAGKLGARAALACQQALRAELANGPGTAAELAARCGVDAEAAFRILRRLAADGRVAMETVAPVWESRFDVRR